MTEPKTVEEIKAWNAAIEAVRRHIYSGLQLYTYVKDGLYATANLVSDLASLKKPLPSPEPESAEPDWQELNKALCEMNTAASVVTGRLAVVDFFKKLHKDILEEIGAALGSVAVHELHNRVTKLEAEKPCHAAMTWHIEDIRRILNSVQSTLFTHIGPYPKKDAPVSEHSPHCGCGECKLREAAKPRVPAENATLEEIAAACAKTGRAGESLQNEKPHDPSEDLFIRRDERRQWWS